jgi:hypothetical protein
MLFAVGQEVEQSFDASHTRRFCSFLPDGSSFVEQGGLT